MKSLSDFDDVHSHSCRGPRIITNLNVLETPTTAPGEAWYSAGIHPWDTVESPSQEVWSWLEAMAADPRVAAIGECGLDALRGAPLDTQEQLFRRQLELAASVGKPVIVHCVRAWHRLLAMHAPRRYGIPMIIHGFRGKPALARQLLDDGYDLSFGTHHNAESYDHCPTPRRHRETDTEKQIWQ